MRWLSGLLGSEDERSDDPFEGYPFRMMLHERWQPGLQESMLEEGADAAADAVFAAHDPGNDPDAEYITTLVVYISAPDDDPDEALALQGKEFREGAAADPELESYDIQTIELPAGPALRAVFVRPYGAQVQYYLHTAGWRFDIWFTSPREELPTREIEFEAMARTFELAGNWRDFR